MKKQVDISKVASELKAGSVFFQQEAKASTMGVPEPQENVSREEPSEEKEVTQTSTQLSKPLLKPLSKKVSNLPSRTACPMVASLLPLCPPPRVLRPTPPWLETPLAFLLACHGLGFVRPPLVGH
jgi:hypothetical protein